MELFYCDACGMRIKSGDGQVGPGSDTQRYCENCYVQKFSGSASVPRATTPSPGTFKSGAVTSAPSDSSVRRKPSKQEPVRAPKTGPSPTVIAAAGGGAAALLLIGFMVFGGRSDSTVALNDSRRDEKSEPRPTPASSEALARQDKPAAAAPVFKRDALAPSSPAQEAAQSNRGAAPETQLRGQPTGADAKAETGRAGGGLFAPEKMQAQKQDDFRENYARRRLDELMLNEQKGTLKPAELRKRVSDLASGYSNTAAGKDAAEKLKALNDGAPSQAASAPAMVAKQQAAVSKTAVAENGIHPAEQAKLLLGNANVDPGTPEPEATRILWKNSFDAEADWANVSGTRETAQTSGGTGMAVRSEPIPSGYFVARIELKFSNVPLKLGANSWVKLAYRTQGTADICFHVAIGGAVYERFMFGILPGKWKTTSFRLNEFGKCITRKNESQPAPNSELSGITMFLGGANAAGASVLIDDVLIGDGPIPEN